MKVAFVGAFMSILVTATPARTQSPTDVAARCTMAGGSLGPCNAAAVAGRSLMAGAGLLAGFGSEVSGTSSNLGARIGGGPRWSFSARAGAVRFGLPDLADPAGLGEVTLLVPAVHTGVTLGLFDGFRLMPTVGGFLSADVFGHANFLRLPQADGFEGGIRSFAAGVRIGIFREGFSFPGVSVSAALRFPGSLDFADTGSGDAADLSLSTEVRSLRATVGKDLFAVELMAGVGWDEYHGSVMIRASDGLGGVSTSQGTLESSRLLYFGSAAMTFNIVLSLSVEGGWAKGLDPVVGYSGEHDPLAGTPFGSFALRLTL